jgi:hypothetical protein
MTHTEFWIIFYGRILLVIHTDTTVHQLVEIVHHSQFSGFELKYNQWVSRGRSGVIQCLVYLLLELIRLSSTSLATLTLVFKQTNARACSTYVANVFVVEQASREHVYLSMWPWVRDPREGVNWVTKTNLGTYSTNHKINLNKLARCANKG